MAILLRQAGLMLFQVREPASCPWRGMIAGFPLRPIARTPNHITHRVQSGGCRLPTGGWMQSWMRRWTRDQSGWTTLMRWSDLLRGPLPQVGPCQVNVGYEEESR